MRLYPSEVGRFQTAERAQAWQNAQRVLSDHQEMCAAMMAVDNQDGIDLNNDSGKVVVTQHLLQKATSTPPDAPPVLKRPVLLLDGEPVSPPEPAEEAEQHPPLERLRFLPASGEMSFDPHSKQVQSLSVVAANYSFSQSSSSGWLGLGEPRTQVTSSDGGLVRQVCLFADGSLNYSEKRVQPSW